MSKHDIYSITEEIKRYYKEEDFEAAAELADSVDWKKVKNWNAFAIMTDVYENLGEFENARDMSILAYNRNLGGNKLLYRLTELLIKTGDLDDAEDIFNEYCQLSGNAPDSYILEYHILRAKNAPDKELIRVLEEFKEAGPDDRYMYRLAELYAKNGEKEKCAEICDNIALWFKDGDFAEGAVKLKKKLGEELSPEQEKLFKTATVKDEDLRKTSKVDFKGQIDHETHDGEEESKIAKGAAATAAGAAVTGAAVTGAAATGAAGKLKNLVKNVFNDEEFDDGETQEIPIAGTGASAAAQAAAEAGLRSETEGDPGISQAEEIKNEGVTDKNGAVGIDHEIKKNLSDEVREELKTESALRGEGVYEGEKPIDGQVNMTDWMTDVREKKYEGQSTKEYSKSELDRILEEKDEKSKAYDRLMAEQKKLAETSGKPFNEDSAKRKVELQLAVDAARRDLDIRTGKGTARQESAAMASAAVETGAAQVVSGDSGNNIRKDDMTPGSVTETVGEKETKKKVASEDVPSKDPDDIKSAVLSMIADGNADMTAFSDGNVPPEIANAAALLAGYMSSGSIQQSQPAEEKGSGGALHKKAEKAREIFGDVKKDRKNDTDHDSSEIKEKGKAKADAVKDKAKVKVEEIKKGMSDDNTGEIKPHEIEALKEIQGSRVAGSATAAVKGAENSGVREEARAEKTFDAAIEDIGETVDKKAARSDKDPGKPDIGKMRIKDVTDEHIVAHLTAEEARVAESKMTQDEAADIIQKRITAPVDTEAVEKAVAASAADAAINIKTDDTFTDTAHIDKKTLREIIESSENDESAEGKNTRRFDTTAKQDTAQLDNVLREDLSKGKREKIKAMFDEYYDMPEIDAQIEEYIGALPVEITREDSRNGNVVITGPESVDKTALAKTLAKAVNISYPKKKKRVIRTTGENLNRYGFAKSADKLRGTFLVIENAGLIKPEVVSEIVDVMSKNTDRMIVIAEDTDSGIESFMNTNPALAKLFNHRINMRPFTTDELVDIAKELAGQKGFRVDDEGALALYLEIDAIKASEPKVSIDDMDALTDDAIAHARKRIKKETGVNPKKMDEDICVLTNEDFNY